MAPTLQDFNKKGTDTQQLRIEAFQPRQKPSPAANPDTINNIAGYGAALDTDGQIESVYRSISTQLSHSTNSTTLDDIINKWQENDIKGSMDALREVMVDPNISQEQKTEILYNFQNGRGGKSLAQMTGESALLSDDHNETEEQAEIRARIMNDYNDVNQYNAWTQKQINVLNSQANPNFVTHVKTMVQSFIPFADAADQAFFENALSGLEGAGGVGNAAQTLLLLGEGRDRLRKTLSNVPIEERRKVVLGMVEAIKSTSGVLANDAQTLRAIQNLERMIVPGAYNDSERFWDNAFSILDDTILLSPFSRTAKNIGRAISGGRAGDVAEGFEGVAARSAGMADEAPQLQIEYRPPMADWSRDVDDIVDALPVEPSSGNITQLRSLINDQLNNSNFSIDDIIAQSKIVDELNSGQIIDLRQRLGQIREKRRAYLGIEAPTVMPTRSEVVARQVSSNPQPRSLAMTYKDTHRSKAVEAHDMIVNDQSGQTARILAGTSRDNALAHDYLPEVGTNGRVAHKIEYDEAEPVPNKDLLKHVEEAERSRSWVDKKELANVQKKTVNWWKDIAGLRNRSAMATIEDLGYHKTEAGVRINQVYGPKDGGFSNAYTAIDFVRAATAKYGIKDEELTVLSRQKDGTYAPVTTNANLTQGDFLIQVNHDFKFDPKEVQYNGYDIGKFWKWLKVPDIKFLNREGGLVQQAVPKSVNIDPRTYVPGIAAADRASGIQTRFLDKAKSFAEKWKKLNSEQQSKVDDYIRKANEQELRFNSVKIRAEGIGEEGLDALRDWKEMQDTLFHLENMDIARGLRDRGFEMFEHRASDTKLIVERMGRTTIPNNAEVYDVATDSFIVFSQKNIDELYEGGGAIVKPRGDTKIQGRDAPYILSSADGSTGFARRIRDDDRILNYRHGYYHVRYEDPYYVTKRDPKTGKVSTIARAATSKDAGLEARRLQETGDGFEYSFKRDRADQAFENHVDVATNFGRSAQRVRGQRLERVKGANDKTLGDQGLESPFDSLTRSISSIAHRTSYRNVLDAERRRWTAQWSDLMPRDDNGVPHFPKTVDEILDNGTQDAIDARHAYRHLEQLQEGYGNMTDDMFKSFANRVSDFGSSKGWDWLDKLATKVGKFSPSAAARLTAFKLYLAANPVRQVVLQAAPAIVTVSALNPLGWGRVVKNAGILGAWHRGVDLTVTNKVAKYGLNMDETRDMIEAYKLSGMDSAVNAHVYLRDQVGSIADVTMAQKLGSVLTAPLNFAQKIGFDFGEQSLMTLTWLSEYDRMTRKLGRTKLNATERDQLAAKVRALTGDMNKGGDMPYNSNSFSVVMQFMQTPHKIAAGLIMGHRGLTGSERLRLAAGYTFAFGIPVLPVIDQFVDGLLPEGDPKTRDMIKGGLTNTALNAFLTSISGEQTNVDFSGDLQPFTMEPLVNLINNGTKMSVQDFLGETAAVSLFMENGRINNFVRSVWDWMTPGTYESVDEARQVGLTFMQLFSGVSNTMKAKYILEHGKITTSSGQVVDDDVSYMEAIMKAAGFQTIDEVYYWAGNQTKWEIDGSIDADVETLVDELFYRWTREGKDPSDIRQFQAVLKSATTAFGQNQAFLDRVADYYSFKTRQNPDMLMEQLINSGLYSPEHTRKILKNSNLSEQDQNTVLEWERILGEGYGR